MIDNLKDTDMDYEKKYKEALKKATEWWEQDSDKNHHPMRDELEKIFPELKNEGVLYIYDMLDNLNGEYIDDDADLWATARDMWEQCRDFVLAGLQWKRASAGEQFPSEALVFYDGDREPRLSKCAVKEGRYLLIADLVKLED